MRDQVVQIILIGFILLLTTSFFSINACNACHSSTFRCYVSSMITLSTTGSPSVLLFVHTDPLLWFFLATLWENLTIPSLYKQLQERNSIKLILFAPIMFLYQGHQAQGLEGRTLTLDIYLQLLALSTKDFLGKFYYHNLSLTLNQLVLVLALYFTTKLLRI